jgi:auxin efflux carrier family
MFVWSSSASPVSEANLRNAVNHAASTDFASAPPPAGRQPFPSAAPLPKVLSHPSIDAHDDDHTTCVQGFV